MPAKLWVKVPVSDLVKLSAGAGRIVVLSIAVALSVKPVSEIVTLFKSGEVALLATLTVSVML